ncbi:MAG TPA: hypothetical protein VHC94_10280 [Nitrobacter sp.]|nr:hypothetical protein [Nitrobacter sp.]
MSNPELVETNAAVPEQAATMEAGNSMARANQRTVDFMFGAQKLMLEEMIFVGSEILERSQIEMHLFSEFYSKMAAAHSVKDIRTMYEECGKHQIEFMRRDCDRLFKHGEWIIDAAVGLLKIHSLNG